MSKNVASRRLAIAGVLAFALVGCSFGGSLPPKAVVGPAVAPEIVSHHGTVAFNLEAAIDPSNGFPVFVFQGDYDTAPTIRVKPGDTLDVFLSDDLPAKYGMASYVNLHFHGLGVSPRKPSDDVLTMLAAPGQALHYVVRIPASQPPGLYWYHTHVHGETNYQVGEGGMSGALIVEGIAKRIPALAKMRERVLVVRELGSGAGDIVRAHRAYGSPNHPCAALPPDAILTINRNDKPTIHIDPGEQQFFRIVNATGHRTLDLSVGGAPLQIVAIDGYPISTSAGEPATLTRTHFVVPPAGRVEFVITGASAPARLITRCFDSGPIGDGDPEATLAYLRGGGATHARTVAPLPLVALPQQRVGPAAALPPPAASRTVVFTEDANGFYINGKAYAPDAKPTFVVHTGTVERWTVENDTLEVHDFHIHQVHFLVQSVDGVPVKDPVWADTFVVPNKTPGPKHTFEPGTIVLIADFRSPIIRGTFLFHCHILDHEDKGMMAKIQAI